MLSKGFGGGERYFVDLALSLANRGHDVQALVHEKFNSRALLAGVSGVRLDEVNSLGMWDRLSLRRMVGLIEAFAPEVMHSHMARAAWAGSKAALKGVAPLIATTHNYDRSFGLTWVEVPHISCELVKPLAMQEK